jgi:hypothetical protein
MSRRERVQQAIDRGDLAELLRLVEFGRCACVGAVDGEPLCRCRMSEKQVRDAVSYAALRRGRLMRLKQTSAARPPSR